jgi:hypothetical protein
MRYDEAVPLIQVRLHDNKREYRPGETLAGTIMLHGMRQDELKSVAVQVLWFTEGKGDRDEGVVYSDELDLRGGPDFPFSLILPPLPLSYHGHLLKIHWCVRVKADMRRGRDLTYEEPFSLTSGQEANWTKQY